MTNKRKPMCEVHQKDLDEMKLEIETIKGSLKEFNVKLDKLFNSIKPAFSVKDKVTFLIGVVIYTVVISTSFNTVDNRSKENEKKIDKFESKIDKVYDLVYEMNKRIK